MEGEKDDNLLGTLWKLFLIIIKNCGCRKSCEYIAGNTLGSDNLHKSLCEGSSNWWSHAYIHDDTMTSFYHKKLFISDMKKHLLYRVIHVSNKQLNNSPLCLLWCFAWELFLQSLDFKQNCLKQTALIWFVWAFFLLCRFCYHTQ